MVKMDGRSKEAKELKAQAAANNEMNTELTDKTVGLIQPKSVGNDDILNIVKTLQEELNALKNKDTENKFDKAKEIFKGPWHYSYQMRGGVPVLDSVSFRKDTSKDLLFKNKHGQMESNHFLRLTLANGEEAEVEVTEYNQHCTRSEKLEAKPIGGGYEFTTNDYGTFTVLKHMIN